MKVLNKFVMGAAALVLLTGCSSMKSVDYKTFHEKAVEAAEKRAAECDYTKVVVKGTIKAGDQETKLDRTLKVEKGVVKMETMEDMIPGTLASITADTVSEEEESKYYVGGGFKVTMKNEEGKGEATFDKYGLVTKYDVAIDDQTAKITFKWSK